MAPLCNVGLCFNPCAQQKIFCPGRLALIRPAVFSRSVFAGLSPHRLALSHGNGLRWPQRFHLSRSTEEANPPSVCHVASCALLPWGGFSSRRLLSKSLTPFPGGSPASPRFPLRRIRLTPFPQSCHGFVLAPSSRQKPRQPRVSANLCCGVVHSRAEPDENPSSDTRKGFLWAQLFRSHEQPFLAGESATTSSVIFQSSVFRPLSSDLCALSPAAAFGKVPPLLRRRCAPLRGAVFQPSENCRFVFFTNALQLCEADVFRVLELALRFIPTLGNGAPAARPPYKLGPRALRALLFPDIYRETETP